MSRRRAALWGLIGALSFLVLHQGYLLLDGTYVGLLPVVGVAVLVGVASGLFGHWLEPRMAELLAEE